MKTYEMLVDGRRVNSYIRGRFIGIIQGVTGTTELKYSWETDENVLEWTIRFDATEEQYQTIMKYLNEDPTRSFVGCRKIG